METIVSASGPGSQLATSMRSVPTAVTVVFDAGGASLAHSANAWSIAA